MQKRLLLDSMISQKTMFAKTVQKCSLFSLVHPTNRPLYTLMFITWGGKLAATSFCTIWASRLKGHEANSEGNQRKIPRCDNCAFFFSDGPCTQYKHRRNFYLFCTENFKKGFTRGTWNYFKASHGKGAPDGIGATLKRWADRLVSQGVDIPIAMSLYQALNDGQSKVKLFYIQEQDIEDAVKEMPTDLPSGTIYNEASPGFTSLLHCQVITLSPGKMLYHDISCMCSANGNLECSCQKTKSFGHTEDLIHSTQEEQWHTPEVVGKWCALLYEGHIYPGIIQEVNETHCQVKCMQSGEKTLFLAIEGGCPLVSL